jgi:hypothetical protein
MLHKSLLLLITFLGCIASVAANNLRLMNRVTDIHTYNTKRAMARGILKKRGGILSDKFGFYAALQGLSTGLQFQEGYDSTCSLAIEAAILSSESATNTLTSLWNPQMWASFALDLQNTQDSTSAVCSYCNLNKLIESITTAFGEGLSTMTARVTASFISNELPSLYFKYVNADDDYVRGYCVGKAAQIVVNWSIQ